MPYESLVNQDTDFSEEHSINKKSLTLMDTMGKYNEDVFGVQISDAQTRLEFMQYKIQKTSQNVMS